MSSARLRAALGFSAAAVLALALGSQYGCSFADAPPLANRCEGDGDCRTGTCDVELGMCTTEVREPIRIGLEVLPETTAAGGTPILVSFESFELDGPEDEPRLLVLPEPVRTSGLVWDTRTEEAITATVTFNLQSAFEAGPSTRLSAQAVEEVTQDGENRNSNLTVSLLPGRDYDITVTPTGAWAARRPPLRVGATYRSPSGSDSAFLDFLNYPDLCTSAVMEDPSAEADCLVEMSGTVVDGEGEPQDQMIVRVVRAETNQLLSSVYTTGADTAEDVEAGTFRVVLPLAAWRANDWLYTVTPSAERIEEEGPSPTFSADPSSLFEVGGMVTILTPEVGTIVTYQGLVEDDRGRPVENASVSLSALNVVDGETGVVGSFRTSTTTGVGEDAGRFEVQLLPGTAEEQATYDVVVTPEASSEIGETLRILRQTVRIGPEQGEVRGQVFQVPFRAQYGGVVRTPEAVGFEAAQIRARPRGVDWMGMLGPIASLARSSSTVTDLDGVFNVNLDVGVYDVVVEPAGGSNYPWLVVPDQPIGGSAAPLNNVFELATPVTMTGVARFEGTALAVGAEVRAYAIVESTDTSTRAIQIGRAVTDESGAFTLLLPPSI
ncbi:MAG: hypothetical protein AB8I08_03240 [Sandaracinaceae bacterium]